MADNGGILAKALKAFVPPHERIFVSTLLGDRSPITADNFTPQELAQVQKAVGASKDRLARQWTEQETNAADTQQYLAEKRQQAMGIYSKAAADPDWIAYGNIQRTGGAQDTKAASDLWGRLYDKYGGADNAKTLAMIAGGNKQEIESALSREQQAFAPKPDPALSAKVEGGSGAVQYPDYVKPDPMMNVLGRFKYTTGPDGKITATDRYDFNNEYREPDIRAYQAMSPAKRALVVALKSIGSIVTGDPWGAASEIGNAYIGNDGRPVKITYDPSALPKQ